MNKIQVFENKDFGEVRTLSVKSEPYFMLADVCRVLEIGNPSQAKTRLKKDGVISNEVIDSLGRIQTADFISESNLYKLVFQSRKPQAEKFSDWVTSEVLPSIRKHGGYIAGQENLTSEQILANAVLLAQSVIAEKDNLIKQQEQMLAEYEPKVTYHDLILQTPDLLSVSQIAKDYGKSAQWLNDKLKEFGVQYKQGGVWLLRQEHAGFGYTKSKTSVYNDNDGNAHSKLHTYWTQKGRLFIYDLLKQHGYLPLIEQV